MSPFKAVWKVNEMFKNFEGKDLNLLLPKLLYVSCNLVILSLAAYKFSNMGIIPVLPADWAGLFNPKESLESNVIIISNN